MKKHSTITICKGFLNFLLFMLGLWIMMFAVGALYSGADVIVLTYIISCSIYFIAIYNLRKIVYSTDLTPFCFDNIKRFKNIGYSMLVMAVFDGIVNWKVQSHFMIFSNGTGSLKGSFVMYIILACIALVLAEIFEKAVELKNDNDLTI